MIEATKSPATYTTYESGLAKFQRFLWDDEVFDTEDLRVPGHWVSYAERLAGLNYAPRSRTVYNAAAKQLLDWLVMHGYVDLDEHDRLTYERAVATYRGKSSNDPKVPDLERVAKVSAYAVQVVACWEQYSIIRVRDAVIFLFLLETGCRIGELVKLRPSDIDWSSRSAVVTGKGNKTRHVMYGEKTYVALCTYLAWWHGTSDPQTSTFFVSHRGRPLTTHGARLGIKRLVGDAGERGFALTPHMLRHAFATIALGKTGNLALVQDLLGHASPETTRVYAKFTDRVKRSEYDKIWGGHDALDSN